jgi:hypothetical protein
MMADVCGSSYSGGLRLGFQSKNWLMKNLGLFLEVCSSGRVLT